MTPTGTEMTQMTGGGWKPHSVKSLLKMPGVRGRIIVVHALVASIRVALFSLSLCVRMRLLCRIANSDDRRALEEEQEELKRQQKRRK